MRALVLVLVACGGGSKPAPIEPVAKPSEPEEACPHGKELVLRPDGRLPCRELPFTVEFPAGAKVNRVDNGSNTAFNVVLDRGVLAMIVQPVFSAPPPERLRELLESAVKGIVAEAVSTPIDPPKLPHATVATGLRFTTADGGLGEIRGYYMPGWLVSIVAGGRKPETTARPDQPDGKKFLASFALRVPATTPTKLALAEGAEVMIPSNAWHTGPLPADSGIRAAWFFVLPDRSAWLGVRDLEQADHCTKLAAIPDAELPDAMKALFGKDAVEIDRAERVKLGDHAVYVETKLDDRKIVLYVICDKRSMIQVTAAGMPDRQVEDLREIAEPVAKTVRGSR